MAHNSLKLYIRTFFQRELTLSSTTISSKRHSHSEALINKEKRHNAQNYAPLPVVICRGQGTWVWDVDGKKYLDFLAGFAALNVGHTHPKILKVLQEQAATLSHTSRAYYNNILPEFVEHVTQYFKYDRVLTMNTGVEGGETAVKIARRWGYRMKKIPDNEAVIIFVQRNFWGRTLSAISTSNSPTAYEHYGPFMPGFKNIPYDNVEALEEALKNPNVCAFMMEPIQGEAGVIVPKEGYLKEVRRLCSKYNVLWIADEIQTGMGRTGRLLAVNHEEVRPDILILGKGLGGGFLPISAVLTQDNVMSVITPGSHGSTFGGNPLATRVAMTTMNVLDEECVVQNAAKMGDKFRSELRVNLPKEVIPIIRGRGLMNAICLNPDYGSPMDLCMELKDLGLLTKPCDGQALRFTPPLNISEDEINQGMEIICKAVNNIKNKN